MKCCSVNDTMKAKQSLENQEPLVGKLIPQNNEPRKSLPITYPLPSTHNNNVLQLDKWVDNYLTRELGRQLPISQYD